jgi:hypothetical protein
MFSSVLRHLKIQKRTSQQTRESNKIQTDILGLCLMIKMSNINGKGLESTN